MKNQMQIFESRDFGKIRVVEKDGQPWFVGKDVAEALGYGAERNALKLHVDDEDKLTHQINASGQRRNMTIINESGLYSLILSSKLPTAKIFKRWITADVIPSIRKHGAYMTDALLEEVARGQEAAFELIQRLSTERAQNAALLDHVGKLAPKARYCDVILQCENAVQVSIIAKDYGMSAIAFNKLLNGLRVQYKAGGSGTWLLYSKYAGEGYTVTRTYHASDKIATIHSYWTQRGRRFLYDLLSWYGILPTAERTGGALIGGDGDFS